MRRKNSFGQIIITVMFMYSAILCHFHASGLLENGETLMAVLFWIFGFTAVLGALRFKIESLIHTYILKNKKNKNR